LNVFKMSKSELYNFHSDIVKQYVERTQKSIITLIKEKNKSIGEALLELEVPYSEWNLFARRVANELHIFCGVLEDCAQEFGIGFLTTNIYAVQRVMEVYGISLDETIELLSIRPIFKDYVRAYFLEKQNRGCQ